MRTRKRGSPWSRQLPTLPSWRTGTGGLGGVGSRDVLHCLQRMRHPLHHYCSLPPVSPAAVGCSSREFFWARLPCLSLLRHPISSPWTGVDSSRLRLLRKQGTRLPPAPSSGRAENPWNTGGRGIRQGSHMLVPVTQISGTRAEATHFFALGSRGSSVGLCLYYSAGSVGGKLFPAFG